MVQGRLTAEIRPLEENMEAGFAEMARRNYFSNPTPVLHLLIPPSHYVNRMNHGNPHVRRGARRVLEFGAVGGGPPPSTAGMPWSCKP